MKKILGLDLGTTSIGWAFVQEAEKDDNKPSKIIKAGVRVLPLTTDEKTDFAKGKAISTNADRTLARGARRNLDRYQLRRKKLLEIMQKNGLIDKDFIYAENSKNSTFSTYKIRAAAATEKIELEDFAKVLLNINKKRGYKSSRKAKTADEGEAIDGLEIAKKLQEQGITPGQLVLNMIKENKKYIPEFYSSDLKLEFEKVWNTQKIFYPEELKDEFKKDLIGLGRQATQKLFLKNYKIHTAENKGKREEQKLKHYTLRAKAINEKLELSEVAFVITEINHNLNTSSAYLGKISDRSKELHLNKITIGQYFYNELKNNPHKTLANQVFYRQDYLDEFETIWETQAKFHKILTPELKKEIRDVVIFYQRKLKSQKHLVSNCEFEPKRKVCPKSSPLFQEFKIWQNLNNFQYVPNDNSGRGKISLSIEQKEILFEELNTRGRLTTKDIFEILKISGKKYSSNFKEIEGNNTNKSLYEAYLKIAEIEGLDNISLAKNKATDIKLAIKDTFQKLGIDTEILEFDSCKSENDFDKQKSYKLWHLLYSLEEDEPLKAALTKQFGFAKEHLNFLLNVPLQANYASLSARAIHKLLPHLKEGSRYDEAAMLAGYGSHSKSLTKEELENRHLDDKLELLQKNSLRNPVVEKILNQMINVINAVFDNPEMGKPDEIRIELARELKQSAKEREKTTDGINKSTTENEKYKETLKNDPFNISNPTRNDIIRYKLYLELAPNGFKTLYSNTPIHKEELFSKNFDIEHIIPKSKLFDDSFSNKTIEARDVNIKKGNATALDFVKDNYGSEALEEYKSRVTDLFKKTKKAKYDKLMMQAANIPDGFIDRDMRNTQYIAKKAKEILEKVIRTVSTTTGSVTSKLREDWGLVNIMQELNFDKYYKLGLIEKVGKKDGSFKTRIKDWSKRNDHRHHAMDAITVAFTKPVYIQYLNNLNARTDKNSGEISDTTANIYGIEDIYLKTIKNGEGNKRVFIEPSPNFRSEAKEALENILVSFKAKNKVVTRNKNKIKGKKEPFIQLTPRGQLHKETIYGKIKKPVPKLEKVNASFNEQKIETVTSPIERTLLLERLKLFNNDPKKAFTGKNDLEKNPIYKNKEKDIKIKQSVKTLSWEDQYTIKKPIPNTFKDIGKANTFLDKVIDEKIKIILKNRLKELGAKDAFANLDKNPIWLNKEKGIDIKNVKIKGVNEVQALHSKKDNLGNFILDNENKKIPVDFVSTGNNHHVAIYKDEKGNLQEEIVSFFEALERVQQGIPIINKNHEKGWEFLFTLKQNEYFIFSDETFNAKEIDLTNPINRKDISKHLYRIQKLSSKDYYFRHHLDTTVETKKELNDTAYKRIRTPQGLDEMVKVRINHLGEIVKIGEY